MKKKNANQFYAMKLKVILVWLAITGSAIAKTAPKPSDPSKPVHSNAPTVAELQKENADLKSQVAQWQAVAQELNAELIQAQQALINYRVQAAAEKARAQSTAAPTKP